MATNKLEYFQKIFPISSLNEDEILLFSMVGSLYGDLGFGEYDYSDAQKIISAKMNFSSGFTIFSRYYEDAPRAYFHANSRFLERNRDEAKEIFSKILESARFDEIHQIRNIFSEKILGLKSALTSSGNATAMLRASSGHTFFAQISERLSGIKSLEILKKFIEKSDAEIIAEFEKIAKKTMLNTPIEITISGNNSLKNNPEKNTENFDNCTISEKNNAENIKNFDNCTNFVEKNFQKIDFGDFAPYRTNEAWLTDLSVGYAAYSIKTIPPHHNDAPLLTLLGQFLRDGYLHSAIREQGGAYGAGANYDGASESFRFFSYRDPRIS